MTPSVRGGSPRAFDHHEEQPVSVIFRRWNKRWGYGAANPIAIFPNYREWFEPEVARVIGADAVLCYEHVGQHGEGFYSTLLQLTKLANPSDPDVQELKAELERIGYSMVLRKRRRHPKP